MAARVQGTTGTTGATFPATLAATAFGSSVTVGDTIVVALMVDGLGASTTFTMVDNKSNTYTRQSTKWVSGIDQVDVWTAPVTTGGTGLIVTAGNLGGTTAALIIEEWSGITASPLDQQAVASATASSAMAVGPTASTTNANDVIWLAFAGTTSTTTTTTATGFSNATRVVSSPSVLFVQSKTVAATGTQSASATLSGAVSWEACIVALKGSAATTTHNLMLLGVGT